ncbi:hypothetical protein Rumeso_02489 [Rubellimicrobium mesophilum DSM 19309]|uniref:PD-(D/E)XK nuclease superfamily protein n=1 Tax=Rubellimicrobium mesophilum DSM 19309 TaxID=442562 RepID=A0A017HQA0_9RHOB|nr:PD-(D/E)XK nuclease family protein [Rubellimicrobium mesophilum]EYD75944.1 hypothetical protein Rumeso_02489 [Rubellimicrobium mesophilum DSM 19309]
MNIDTLLDTVHARLEAFRAARELYGERLAPGFSPFQFIPLGERDLSELLAWLLDPRGSHGQGGRFLGAFLARLGRGWADLPTEGAQVRTEAPTDRNERTRRSIDILVQGRDWTLGIENKLRDAADQPRQVADYLGHLDALAGPPRGLLYLTRRGGLPSERSIDAAERERRIAAGELHLWSALDLLPWLEACRVLCRADRVATFIDEFFRTIQREFEGVRDMAEQGEIIKAATVSPERVEAAMELLLAGPALRTALLGRLETDVETKARAEGWTVVRSTLQSKDNPGVEIDFGAADHVFSFEFPTETGRLDSFDWGLRLRVLGHPVAPALKPALDRAFGEGGMTPWWPWFKSATASDAALRVDEDWEVSSRPWVMVASGEMGTLLIAAAQEVRAVLKANTPTPLDPDSGGEEG